MSGRGARLLARAACGGTTFAASLVPAFLLGAATVFGFAPFNVPALPLLTLGLLLLLWQDASPRRAARTGFAFGLGLFGAGVSWVYVALNTFGGMPLPLAALATAGFCAYLALYPAAAGWLAARLSPARSWSRAVAGAAAWALAEWTRSFVFTGFPWLSLGYAQIVRDGATPLGGFAAVGGVFAVTLAGASMSAALAVAIPAVAAHARRRLGGAVATALAVVVTGALVDRIEWTRERQPVAVSLLQGNVTQEQKFDPGFRERTFELYARLLDASRGRLVVFPESALPVFADEVPAAVFMHILRTAKARDADVLVGLFTVDPPLPEGGGLRYYNSALSLGASAPQIYRKRHLVPFGETIPADPVLGWFIRSVLSIPLASQSAGAPDQRPLEIAGQSVAVNICYEDAFGAELRAQASAATLLVNMTNDAWYGRSLAAEQHNQIAAMRAKETGRPLLRATNTGITSALGHDGRELARLPWFVAGILEVEVVGREGVTPYVRVGDAAAATLAALLLAAAAWHGRQAPRRAPERARAA